MTQAADVKRRARWAVKYALQSGRLIKGPCADGSDDCRGSIEAHHTDYAQPLTVRWLCRFHHTKVERAIRRPPPAPDVYVGGPIPYDPATPPARARMLERLRQYYLRRQFTANVQPNVQPRGRVRSNPECSG